MNLLAVDRGAFLTVPGWHQEGCEDLSWRGRLWIALSLSPLVSAPETCARGPAKPSRPEAYFTLPSINIMRFPASGGSFTPFAAASSGGGTLPTWTSATMPIE